ncbi:MAG: quinone-dependent dihydroorotate dehydrogenase [Verrucomicrobiota bacterium]|nr:quinone-dependent dihydroorotate dehydrogenase [Verrucomicrobiota bacterium]
MRMYDRLIRPLLFSLDPEMAHHLAMRSLRLASDVPALLAPLRRFQPPARPQTVFGLNFPNPIGLAAGFDKNAVALPTWEALGFGFVEIGTVTAQAQPGNPKPRIFRFPEQQALINRLGFNNDGADVIAARLANLRACGRWPRIPVGINIGKSKATPLENAADDYRYSFRRLSAFADYVVLNVSSPNTPGLRLLQEHGALVDLVRAITEENRTLAKPILLKIAPDLSLEDLEQIISTCEAHGIAGLIATNTTIDHSAVPRERDETGGLSGTPLREKSTEFVRAIRARTKLPIIGVGGINDAVSAGEKFAAGATLVQVYTGFIYRGPRLLREIAAAAQ